jgi:hypothetical protein
MTFWVAGAVVGSSLIGANAASKASSTQAASADQATQLQREMFNKQLELQEPFRQSGINALNKIESGDIMGSMDPSYSFRFQEGLKALDRSAAARGGLLSGGALKAAQRYGQDFASQEFGNAYNRLASRAGFGQTATGAMGTAAGQFGANAGNLMTSGAAARASGYVGGANALTGGLNQYLNYTQNANMLNTLQNRGSMPYSMSGDYSVNPNYTFGGSLNTPVGGP